MVDTIENLAEINEYYPVGKIAAKAVCRSVFLTTALYFDAELTKTPSDCFFGDFAYWVTLQVVSFALPLLGFV